MIKTILKKYPKKRFPLSYKHKKRFELDYKANRDGNSGVIGRITKNLESWMHKKIADDSTEGTILEVGAGTLNHIEFENTEQPYDIVEPFKILYKNKNKELIQIRNIYNKISDIPKNNKYSRIISVATLEHMITLPEELSLLNEKLEPNGIFQAGVPTEGGFLWGISWRLTTAIAYRIKTGLNYNTIMKHEHVNNIDEILALIKHYFKDVKYERFPFNHKHFSFYTYITAKKK